VNTLNRPAVAVGHCVRYQPPLPCSRLPLPTARPHGNDAGESSDNNSSGLNDDEALSVRSVAGLRAYTQSKKALALFTIELARRLQDDNVTANIVDPFLVRTDLTSDHDVPLLFKAARPAMIKPATAARWVARVATDPNLEGTTGRHFMLGHRAPGWPGSRSHRKATRLWDATTELVATPTPTSSQREENRA
jgi:NAD(P)-dependent dehydrogenase (short-subunit alcohol dehydrogenase family)